MRLLIPLFVCAVSLFGADRVSCSAARRRCACYSTVDHDEREEVGLRCRGQERMRDRAAREEVLLGIARQRHR